MSGIVNEEQIKYIANPDYVLREIVGEYMLIPTGKLSMTKNGVITISESAAYLWKKMDEGKTLIELCELLLEEYDIDKETALADVKEMVDSMCEVETISRITGTSSH